MEETNLHGKGAVLKRNGVDEKMVVRSNRVNHIIEDINTMDEIVNKITKIIK